MLPGRGLLRLRSLARVCVYEGRRSGECSALYDHGVEWSVEFSLSTAFILHFLSCRMFARISSSHVQGTLVLAVILGPLKVVGLIFVSQTPAIPADFHDQFTVFDGSDVQLSSLFLPPSIPGVYQWSAWPSDTALYLILV